MVWMDRWRLVGGWFVSSVDIEEDIQYFWLLLWLAFQHLEDTACHYFSHLIQAHSGTSHHPLSALDSIFEEPL